MTLYFSVMDSPVGPLRLIVDDEGSVVSIEFPGGRSRDRLEREALSDGLLPDEERTAEVRRQLGEYFAGDRQSFDLKLAPRGTEFQQEVWKALQDVPFGTTTSYGALADAIGRPAASRAVGAANGANPIPIVVPCHRIIGADGSLTGFGGGLEAKRLLLELEGHEVEPGPRQLRLDLAS